MKRNGMSWVILIELMVLTLVPMGLFANGDADTNDDGKLVYGYVTPGPDYWYKKDVDGFVYAAEQAGVEVLVLNSDYNAEKEISNIDSLINQGVDGMCIFTFNQNGANIAADKCAAAGIPLVVTDNVGQVLKNDSDVVAAIDFDWSAMGKDMAAHLANNYPGENIAVIMGILEHIPVQMFLAEFEPEVKRLGKNEIVAVRDGRYNPEEAMNQAQDLVQSGVDFSLLFIFNDEMAASVVRGLKNDGVLNDPIKVFTTNGAPYGIELMKQGDIKYSISSSPGWEGFISFLALHAYVKGVKTDLNQQIILPIAGITDATIDDKTKVIPWEIDPVWLDLTATYFPEYNGLY
ncbi:sugar ABC transporter substrate-binding protein [Oceanispirochaeta sp.]|uniref:sugar ABC transporter substrate-binding protein n=1 Tax=Oceanispirochaeta sp. TaxID=2035350 RepID=UPI002603FA4A|nr:sugar ABC transporter substrate-binding protein [Oceanispirochaeta sp.]MDA3955757.1 sugar ABC transporter substrate-binding protein [Oceanispirochaeta sp.]